MPDITCKSQRTGIRGEYRVIGKLIEKGYTVYTPVVDIEGIDCIVRNMDGRLIEIQIKTRNKSASQPQFQPKDFKPHKHLFFCCYFLDTDELWTIPSYVFKKHSFLKASGVRALMLTGPKAVLLDKYKGDDGLNLLKLKIH